MMTPEDILKKLRKRPFEPFRLHLSDGSQFDIRHPELAMVTRSTVIVGVPGRYGSEGPVERTVDCSILHITRTELIDGVEQSS